MQLRGRHRIADVGVDERQRVVPLERHLAGQHPVQDDAARIEVRTCVQPLATALLGGHVLRRARHRAGVGERLEAPRRVVDLGDAEVADLRELDLAAVVVDLGGDDDVVGLEVAVDDALVVGAGDRAQTLRHQPHHPGLVQRPLLADQPPEGAPLQELHDEVEEVPLLTEVEDLHAVGVVDARRRHRLAAEALGRLGLLHHRRVEHLYGDAALQGRVLRLVDVAHRALADHLVDAVLAIGELAARECGVLVCVGGLHRRRSVTASPAEEQTPISVFRDAVGSRNACERLYAEGAVHLALRRWADAEAVFRTALEAGGGSFYLKNAQGYGQALHHLGRHDEAADVFVKLCELRPDLLEPVRWRGMSELGRGRPEDALRVQRRGLQVHAAHPDRARLYADGAVALDALGRWSDGVAWCTAALADIGADEPTLCHNLATFHLRLGDQAAARVALRRAASAHEQAAERAVEVWRQWGDGGPL